MPTQQFNILLADDDLDDCTFFKEALEDLPLSAKLTTVHDGVQLMGLLAILGTELPDVLYLDLNMPRKNGFDCLSEIKQNTKYTSLPVIIFSTSFDVQIADLLYGRGAHYYICKPPEFPSLKKIIHKSLNLVAQGGTQQPAKELFVLTNT